MALKDGLQYILQSILMRLFMLMGLFPGMIAAEKLDGLGIFRFESAMRNLAAQIVVIFLVIFFYASYPLFIAPRFRKPAAAIGYAFLALLSLACFDSARRLYLF